MSYTDFPTETLEAAFSEYSEYLESIYKEPVTMDEFKERLNRSELFARKWLVAAATSLV